MSDIAICADNLSKLYHIDRARRHDTLRDALAAAFKRDGLRVRGRHDVLWALKDVSFEAKRGEVVGVIGRNGAGKSTLLRILSRITEPTMGRAVIHGRVGSLLEVGTGFHPELTGRDNIYLNGAILGMRRHEIGRRFDEIVAFAEVDRFLDMPVKHYSSGMYVRLAFAVAAHLEPEILLVDEVLAVGDAQFQKKCLGKMGDVAHEGRTVLFVSHNMAVITQLCPRCLLVRDGRIDLDGPPDHVVRQYLEPWREIRGSLWLDDGRATADIPVRIVAVDCEPNPVFIGSTLSIGITYSVDSDQSGLMFGVSVETTLGQRVFASYTGREGLSTGLVRGVQSARIEIRELPLIPGEYYVTVAVHERGGESIVRVERAATFEVLARDLTNSGHLVDQRNGLVWLDHRWDLPGALNIWPG